MLLKEVYIFALVLTVVVLGIELMMGRHRGIYSAADWKVNLVCILFGSSFVRPLGGLLIAAVWAMLLPQWRNALADLPVFMGFLIVALTSEFAFYWVHRFAHDGARKYRKLGWLWKLHRTHHSGKYMNVLLTFRMTLVWMLIQPQAWVYGIAIYLGQGPATALVIGMVYFWNIITHSNFRWDDTIRCHPNGGRLLRAIEHVIVTPGLHHTHHGFGRDGANYRNFGVMFSLFDWIFGTLHIPNGRPAKYGLPGVNAHWAEEVFYPLIRMPEKVVSLNSRQDT